MTRRRRARGRAGILAAAAGRSLVVVVRDAHRDQNTRSLIEALLAARPDLVLVEMGLPLWRPPAGTSYLATYGASRASAHAAAELLGLPELDFMIRNCTRIGGRFAIMKAPKLGSRMGEGEGTGAGRAGVAEGGTG